MGQGAEGGEMGSGGNAMSGKQLKRGGGSGREHTKAASPYLR